MGINHAARADVAAQGHANACDVQRTDGGVRVLAQDLGAPVRDSGVLGCRGFARRALMALTPPSLRVTWGPLPPSHLGSPPSPFPLRWVLGSRRCSWRPGIQPWVLTTTPTFDRCKNSTNRPRDSKRAAAEMYSVHVETRPIQGPWHPLDHHQD